MAHEIYRRAKAFNQRPSSIVLLDDRVGDIGRFYFDRGIWAFGEAVANRLDEVVAGTRNPVIAQAQREREWARLMGDDMETSTAGFRDVGDVSPHARVIGDPDDETGDERSVDGSYW
jgi:hypothetical protein